ncbi:MAG: acyltransferase [Candidatus Electrothrix sp. Rat3]|nr:acyltransferase [Candidatus Electrothrix rattekaaiensis]
MQQNKFGPAGRPTEKENFFLRSLFMSRNSFSLLASLLFFLVLIFFCNLVLPGASSIELTLQTDHADSIQIFCSNGLKTFDEQLSVSSQLFEKEKVVEVRLGLGNMPMNRMRIDTGSSPGILRIYRMVLHSHFARTRVLNAPEIFRLFKQASPGTTVQIGDGFVKISSTSEDPYLIADQPLLQGQVLLLYGLPLLATTLFFLVLQQINFTRFPAFSDIFAKRPSTGENIISLDGLRGIAAIMVVADHTWGRCTGLGAGGVWIFMSLSGFLLARPFVLQPERAKSVSYWISFFRRRLQRILPVYYLYLIIIFVFHFRFDAALRHFLFLQGDGHLWVVPQEMFFYLLVPFIMVVNLVLFRGRAWLVITHLTVLLILANQFLTSEIFALYGMRDQPIRPFLGIFLGGCTASYLYYGIYRSYEPKLSNAWRKKLDISFAFCGTALLLFFLLCSTKRLWGGQRVLAQDYFPWFDVAAAGLLFSILAGKEKSLVNRFLSWLPLRAISVVSFSLYIFHPLVINCLRQGMKYYTGTGLTGFPLFMSTLLVSYGLACWTYTYIERPFMHQTR